MAQMPDGRTYLWVAHTVEEGGGGFGAIGKTFSLSAWAATSAMRRAWSIRGDWI